jgi:F5/8 type C domain
MPSRMAALLALYFCISAGFAQTGKNLALHRPASGSTPCNQDENPAQAVNGSASGGTSDKFCTSVETKWLQIDLGANTRIASVVLRHSGAGGEDPAWNTRAFKIHVSTDGKTFTTVVNVTDNTADVSTHKFEPVTARYVQLEVITPTQDGDPAARIYEFEIYGETAAAK